LRYSTAPMCTPIRSVTGLVIALGLGFLVASYWVIYLLLASAVVFLVCVGCYLRAPIAYEINHVGLTVEFRLGQKSFGPITRIVRPNTRSGMGLRLWGNGGLFAGTGIFWSSQWGLFRAYVSTSNRDLYLMVETPDRKVLISPDDPEKVLRESESRAMS
jgi:hypothetical protein